ncbi:PIN domain-containing protein [Aliiroseovarius crassostreae]|uniref:PIN domain-containing protein n=1 Tax=Aliiroseovarius crassostreae TaxID=154981 RepID=UPI0021FAE6CA|nr:PIN domain-containing protein [Aliiroseovarius crassostreae]UWP88450.1 PIN domain-containing protein [Aliiroseovarius crassostreae]
MAISLFVDTNVFLSLYAFSDDDIEQFRKLFILSQEGEINFLLPEQVIDEFWRNRESKIQIALSEFRKPPNRSIPALVRELEQFSDFDASIKSYTKAHTALMKSVFEKAAKTQLAADLLIKEIFEKSEIISVSDDIFEKAKYRVEKGNPPGKQGSLGDALNWECIVSKLGFLEEICFVSQDKDYKSVLHDGAFNEFLLKELDDNLFSTLDYFPSLRDFMRAKFPGIKIEAYEEASLAVEQFESSGSFASTHSAVQRLMAVEFFSNKQIDRIVSAAEQNSQIMWIIQDEDLQSLFENIKDKYAGQLPDPLFARLLELIVPEAGEDIIPF